MRDCSGSTDRSRPGTANRARLLGVILRMNRAAPKTLRRRFFVAIGHAIHVTWPVLSTILAIQVALGLLIGFLEGWSVGDAVYFTFVTGLTIGYGDIVPRQALARALAIGIGVSGLFLTGLIAGIAVYAMRTALSDRDTS
jgi:Ion channel